MVDFKINVIVDPSRVPSGTRPVVRELDALSNKANQVRKNLGLTFGALAGGAAIFSAVRSIASFEEAIATAGAVSRSTGAEFEALRDKALELGISTRFTATQAADALVFLSRAGFSVSESLVSVGDTLLLAQAGGLGLAEAADITANTLRGFTLAANESARVVDVLVATTNSANTNVTELGQAMKFVAPVAAGLNQSIEQTAAGLGVLADAGLKATLGGTGLRRVLAELESPGSTFRKILDEVGISAKEIAPSQNELVDILERLRDAGIDTGQALEIFGQRGGPAFQVLISNIDKVSTLTDQLEDKLGRTGGEAKRVADIIDNTLKGALFRTASAIEGFVLALGQAGTSDVIIAGLDGISASFRFLASNADALQVALLALTAGGLAKLISVVGAAALPSIRSFALALVLARGNIIAVTGAASASIGVFTAFAAAVAAVAASAKFQSGILEDIERSINNLADDAGFARVGLQIRQATQELELLQAAIDKQSDRGFGASEAQIARVEKLKNTISDLKGEVRAAADAERERIEREARGAAITEASIARLERRQAALRALTKEQEASAALSEELDKLLEAGALPTSDEKDRIEALIRENTALDAQKQLYDEIRGPANALQETQKSLEQLFARGAITANEYAIKLQEIKEALKPEKIENPLLDLVKENQALADRINKGDLFADAIALENDLRERGIAITREIQDQIAAEVLKKKQLTEQEEKLEEAQRKRTQTAERDQRDIERLAERINIQAQLLEQELQINAAVEQGLITREQAALALEDLNLRGLESSIALGDGFSRAFIKIAQEARDLASVGENIVNVFADAATDAIATFAETGKFQFKEFASAILSDLARILARLLVVQAISAFLPGGAALGGAAVSAAPALGGGGGRARGGTVQPDRSYVVGEDGPELFQPGRTGQIIPNQAGQQQQSPMGVTIVNVQSEDQVPNAINRGIATEAIINVLASNKDRVNQVLS